MKRVKVNIPQETIIPEKMTDETLLRIFASVQKTIEHGKTQFARQLASLYGFDLYSEILRRGLDATLTNTTRKAFNFKENSNA